MPQVTADSTAIAEGGCLVQNLGPDVLYVNYSGVTSADGIEVASGASLLVGETGDTVHAVSAGTSDVRIMDRAEGLFYPPPSA